MAYGVQAVTRDNTSTTLVYPPGRVLPFTYETKRSIPGLGLVLVMLLLFAGQAGAHSAVPVPHPHKYGEPVRAMYRCNTGLHRWTEWEIKCVIRRQFRGEYHNAVLIARCETGDTWNPKLVSHTDDHGIFQINRRWNSEGWRLGANIYDPVWNTRIAYYFWRTRGWSDWTCARIVGIS